MLRALAGAALHARRPDRARRDAEAPTSRRRSATTRSTIYMWTFTAGAALSGLAGGVMAPLTGLLPSSGSLYIAKAFITVITGGAAVISGTLASSIIFGTINQIVSFGSTPVIGEIAMLVLAIILLRLMPQGITGRFFRNST